MRWRPTEFNSVVMAKLALRAFSLHEVRMPTTRINHNNNTERNGQYAEANETGDYARAFAEEAAKASEEAMRAGTRHREARGGGRSG